MPCLSSLTLDASTGDPATPYFTRAGAAIAGVLGEDFAPYLPLVLPPLLASAAQDPEYSVEEVEEEEVQRGGVRVGENSDVSGAALCNALFHL